MPNRVLIITNDMQTRAIISRALRASMISTESISTGEEGISRLMLTLYDLLLVESDLPGVDGLHVVEALRQRGNRTPVIVLGSHARDYEQIYALDLGADDYIVLPCNPLLLAAKVRAVIRRSHGMPLGEVISAGPFTYNMSTLRFYKDGDEILLSSKENALMKLFLDNPDRLFSRSRIYDLVWGGSIVDENTVMVYISRLRAKIEDSPAHPKYIQTVRGLGYRFVV